MDCPPLCPPWALFSCCSRRSSWKTRELFSVPRASNIVCFWISVSVSWWRRFSSSVWLLLMVLFVNWRKEQSQASQLKALFSKRTNPAGLFQERAFPLTEQHQHEVADLVPEFLDFILSILDSALKGWFGAVLLFFYVIQLLWIQKRFKPMLHNLTIYNNCRLKKTFHSHLYLFASLSLGLGLLLCSGLWGQLLLKL